MSEEEEEETFCVQLVTKSLSDRLLSKFTDASELDLGHEQSELWSPFIPHTAFLSSPAGRKIYSVDKLLKKLKKMNNSHDTTIFKKCINRLNGFWCF